MTSVNHPFLVVNGKSYLYDEELLKLAKEADQVAEDTGLSIYFTCPYTDIRLLARHTKNLIITAQSMDALYPGRGMGHVLPDALKAAGARAVFLNHAENQKTVSGLYAAVKRARELDMITILCADSPVEAMALASMKPDILLAEPTDLIGTGTTADDSYVRETVDGIKEVDPHVQVMIASGISTPQDCRRVIRLGADGTGATSGILKAPSPGKMIREMAEAILGAMEDGKR